MSFGSTIKRLRKEHNLTQDQLANLLNVTPQAISRWENNSAMPDISLLIPLANTFRVTTDTLLEVDLEKNEKHIEDYATYVPVFQKPYGETIEEKLTIYRDEVRRYPNSAKLKEALITALSMAETSEGAYPDLSYAREMASLTEDIIEMGGGTYGLAYHKSKLVRISQRINCLERASELVKDASPFEASKEVLLPASLQGREQVDARKDLIFKCTNTIVNTVYAMLEENAMDLSENEIDALQNVEKIVEAVYGKSFSDHFMLPQTLYKGVIGAISRGKREEAIHRLDEIVRHLELMETESPQISPLVLDNQIDLMYLSFLVFYTISNEAKLLYERVNHDFSLDDHETLDGTDTLLSVLLEKIKGFMDSNGGQLKKDIDQSLARLINRRKEMLNASISNAEDTD